MKIVMIMNHNSYAGREYLLALRNANITPDVISIGKYPEINASEEERCGGGWRPPPAEEVMVGLKINEFQSLRDNQLIDYLTASEYDIGIQGGTGIIRQNVIEKFRIGIINFHPGDLPSYRGCSAPEWQLFDGKKIISTCHFIDEGIDSGSIIKKKELILSMESYEKFRSSIYPQTGQFVAEIVKYIYQKPRFADMAKSQNENEAIYRKYIGEDIINKLRSEKFSL